MSDFYAETWFLLCAQTKIILERGYVYTLVWLMIPEWYSWLNSCRPARPTTQLQDLDWSHLAICPTVSLAASRATSSCGQWLANHPNHRLPHARACRLFVWSHLNEIGILVIIRKMMAQRFIQLCNCMIQCTQLILK